MSDELHIAPFSSLTVRQFHEILRLRIDVFVVEQDCAYPELDGSDTLASTKHYWIDDSEGIAAYLRTLSDGSELRIGRVVTASRRRGDGLGAQLMAAALAGVSGEVMLSAQSHLIDWYKRFGFAVSGDQYLEDGIPHTDMRRPAP